MNKNDGGSAYPRNDIVLLSGAVLDGCAGMTLRDYFAGHVMAGMMANDPITKEAKGKGELAEVAYSIADAMIAEREKEKADAANHSA